MHHTYQIILQFRRQSVDSSSQNSPLRYQVEVIKAPGRGWGGPMLTTGLDEKQVRIIRNEYRGFITRQQASATSAGAWTLDPLRLLGNQLFEALPESIQARLREAQAYAQERSGNLEVRLAFDLSAAELLDLPWELLHDPHSRFFYGLRGGGVIRELPLPTAEAEKPLKLARTIGVWSEPAGIESLAERRRFSPAPGKESAITWLQGADSLGQLKHALDTGNFDSLHVVAHGRVGTSWDFALALTDAEGQAHWLNPDQLAIFLSNYPSLRFVYLDVCAGGSGNNLAEEPSQSDLLPGGAGSQLLGVGVTAVVVMQDRISQAASGLMAQTFYQEIAQGASLPDAMTSARRSVQLQQADTIHWSVPALYLPRPTPKESSPLADWILDAVVTPTILSNLLAGLALLVLLGRLTYTLSQVSFISPSTWIPLPAMLVATTLVPILVAAMTTQGQGQLANKYNYVGRGWLPFLWHKYFSVFVWVMMAWLILWLVWLGIVWSGVDALLGSAARQMIWASGLVGIALAAHVGARQAIRQDLLFRRVHFVLFHGGGVDAILLFFLLLAPPFIPLAMLWAIGLLWQTLGGAPDKLPVIIASLLVLGGAALRLLVDGQNKSS